MKKILLVLMVLVLLVVSVAPAAFAIDKFFMPAMCDVADTMPPGAWYGICLIAWLMDMWLSPIDGRPV